MFTPSAWKKLNRAPQLTHSTSTNEFKYTFLSLPYRFTSTLIGSRQINSNQKLLMPQNWNTLASVSVSIGYSLSVGFTRSPFGTVEIIPDQKNRTVLPQQSNDSAQSNNDRSGGVGSSLVLQALRPNVYQCEMCEGALFPHWNLAPNVCT